MPTTLEHGQLSDAAYGDPSSIPSGWKELPGFIYDAPLNGSGYRGHVYINENTNEIVIAHRGTEITDIGDIKADLQIGGNIASNQLNEAREFARQVQWRIENDPSLQGHNVSHTGHSLGGYIASVVGAENGAPVEIFDPPASADYLKDALKSGKITQEQFDYAQQNTTTHLSEGSFIDGLFDDKEYHGNVHKFNVGDRYKTNLKGGFTYKDEGIGEKYRKHKMSEINKSFDNSTGKFKGSYQVSNSTPKEANVFTRINELLAQINASLQQLDANLQIS